MAGAIAVWGVAAGAQTSPGPLTGSIPSLERLAPQQSDSGPLLALRDGARLLDSASAGDRDQLAKTMVDVMLKLRYPDSARALATTRHLTLGGGQFRELSCQFITERRWDNAIAATSELLDPVSAAWSLGHIAVQLSHPPYRRGGGAFATDDTLALRRRAALVARGIALPDARVDALLAVAGEIESPRSKPDSILALALYRDASLSVDSIADGDRRSARGAMIAVNLARYGDNEGARALLPLVVARRDWWILAWSLASITPRDSIGMALRSRVVAEARKRVPPGARSRRRAAESLAKALRQGGDSAQAAEVEQSMLHDPWTFRPEHRSRSQYEIALDAAQAGETALAARAAERVPASDDPERRVRVWIAMANQNYSAPFAVRQGWLLRARAAALAARVDSARRDDLLAEIASQQFYNGANDDALSTLVEVRADDDRRWPFGSLGHSTMSRLDGPATVRALASHASLPVLRDQVLAYLVSDWLTGARATSAELTWGAALIDSISDSKSREQAVLAVGERMLQRGDSARARRLVVGLLAEAGSDRRGKAASFLVRAGERRALFDWAHSRATPEARIGALIVAAQALEQPDRGPIVISNGPDDCRHPF